MKHLSKRVSEQLRALSPSTSPRLFLFDLDGTLVRFPKEVLFSAAKEAAAKHKIEILEDALDLSFRAYDFFSFVESSLRDSFIASVSEILDVHEYGRPTLLPGSAETLNALKPFHQLGIATARIQDQEVLRNSLSVLGIADLFATVRTRADDSILWTDKSTQIAGALKETGVAASEAVFVGDTPDDIASAKRAGLLMSIAVKTGDIDEDKLLEAEPDLLLGSVVELVS